MAKECYTKRFMQSFIPFESSNCKKIISITKNKKYSTFFTTRIGFYEKIFHKIFNQFKKNYNLKKNTHYLIASFIFYLWKELVNCAGIYLLLYSLFCLQEELFINNQISSINVLVICTFQPWTCYLHIVFTMV